MYTQYDFVDDNIICETNHICLKNKRNIMEYRWNIVEYHIQFQHTINPH